MHPPLVNFFIDSNDEWLRPGTTCPSLNFSGRPGILSTHVWVLFSYAPFGILIWIGFLAGIFWSTGAPAFMKWSVHPLSAKASSSLGDPLVKTKLFISSSCFSSEQFECTTVCSSSSLLLIEWVGLGRE